MQSAVKLMQVCNNENFIFHCLKYIPVESIGRLGITDWVGVCGRQLKDLPGTSFTQLVPRIMMHSVKKNPYQWIQSVVHVTKKISVLWDMTERVGNSSSCKKLHYRSALDRVT